MRSLLMVLILILISPASFPLYGPSYGLRAQGAAAQLEAGMAAVEFQLPEGTPLGGFGGEGRRLRRPNLKLSRNHVMLKPHEGTLDPIRAKALLVRSGDRKLLFIGVDAIGVTEEVHQDLVDQLAERGYREEEVIFSATHTHSGPGALSKSIFWASVAMDFYQKRVYQSFMQTVHEAIVQAEARLKPAEIRYSSFEVPELSHNRRGNRESVDPTARVLWVREHESGRWLGAMVNYAVHGVALGEENLHFSADVPGGIERAIEERLQALNSDGSRPVALFVNGAEGDISPARGGVEGISEIGNRFGDIALEHAGEGLILPGEWKLERTGVDMGRPGLNMRTCADFVRPGKPNRGLSWLSPEAAIGVSAFFPHYVKLWSIEWGGLRMMTWPGEATNALGQLLRRSAIENGARDALVLGLANGHLAYFTTPEEFEAGGYEACTNLYGRQGGLKIIQAYEQLMRTR